MAIRIGYRRLALGGVPFYLRTGKRLPAKCSRSGGLLQKSELNLFKESQKELPQNKLTIRLQPDEGVDIRI